MTVAPLCTAGKSNVSSLLVASAGIYTGEQVESSGNGLGLDRLLDHLVLLKNRLPGATAANGVAESWGSRAVTWQTKYNSEFAWCFHSMRPKRRPTIDRKLSWLGIRLSMIEPYKRRPTWIVEGKCKRC